MQLLVQEKGWEIVTPAEEQSDFYADIYPDLGGNIKHSDATQLEALQDKEYSNCRYKNLVSIPFTPFILEDRSSQCVKEPFLLWKSNALVA